MVLGFIFLMVKICTISDSFPKLFIAVAPTAKKQVPSWL